jgi:Holliday junction resolvasome RuvABC endonuclease subunit
VTTVLGIDPSYDFTGIAVHASGGVRTLSVRTHPNAPRWQRQRTIADAVIPWLDPDEPTTCIVEGVYIGGFGRTSLDLAGMHDVIIYELMRVRPDTRIGIVAARSAKLFATGSGKATKADMVTAAKILLGITVKNHNEADALWLATMGLYSLGRAETLASPERGETVNKIQWIGKGI